MFAYLQEAKDLLFFFSIHILFLKELKVGNKATTWTYIPAMNQSVPERIQIKKRMDNNGHHNRKSEVKKERP